MHADFQLIESTIQNQRSYRLFQSAASSPKILPLPAMSLSRKRLATFQKAQASLPEVLRLENRNDLDQYHQAEKAASTIAKYRSAKRWFIEYLEFQHPNEDADRSFNPSHPPPDRSLLNKYVIFMAQPRVGYINDSISVRTLINYT